jgi:periplasmic protein TonB
MDIRIPETKKAFLSLFSLSAALFLQFFLIIALYETCGSCNEKNSDVLKTVKINLVSVSNENASVEPDSPKILTEPPPEILPEKQLLALPEMPPAILDDMVPPIVPDIPTEVLPKAEIIKPITQPATVATVATVATAATVTTAAPQPTARAAADTNVETPIKAQRSTALTDESSKYLIKVRTIIEKNKKYPIKARKKQTEGTVSLSFSISKAGRISKLTVLESPDKSLADASTELLKSVKLPKPPAAWNETKAVKFEINYRLR